MNWPTFFIALAVAAVFVAILAKGIYNKKHHKGGSCSCGGSCSGCPGGGLCHPEEPGI